jgi:Flp pilus assembly protein TadG
MATLTPTWNWRSWVKKGERGAELIEFALVLPLLLLLVLGIVDFGFLFQRLEVVTNAAREGARIAILGGSSYTSADVQDRVCDYLEQGGVPIACGTNPTVDVNFVQLPTPSGGTIDSEQVVVHYSHSYLFLSGLAHLFGGNFSSVPLTGVSTMRVEGGGS